VNRPIQMFNRLHPVSVEVVVRGLQLMLGTSHCLQASSMCGCRSGTGATAGVAGAAATGGAGAAGAFGPAAAAGKASVKRSVAMMSRLKNPIFFICSSSSEFRLGRNRCDLAVVHLGFVTTATDIAACFEEARDTRTVYPLVQDLPCAKGYSQDALSIFAPASPP